jgi:LysM repeat protein
MLTGLGVIVLIGVLLSEYLGERNTGPTVAAGATGNMAPLPVGAGYREQMLTPVGVPTMTPAGGGARTQLAGGVELASGVGDGAPLTMIAAETTGAAGGGAAGPSVYGPAMPIAAGPTLMDRRSEGGPPLITLSETVPVRAAAGTLTGAVTVPGMAAGAGAVRTPAAVQTTYTVAAGDTLAKIARKYYNSSKNSDVQRIVAANPKVLKDATSTLMVNMKLVIPNLPAQAITVPPAPAVAPAKSALAAGSGAATGSAAAGDTGMVYLPSGAVAVPVPGVIAPPKKDGLAATDAIAAKDTSVAKDKPVAKDASATKKPGTYVVQAGDTLEKIARKMTPTKTTETVQKLISLNGLKDPNSLKVGQTLKLPA